MKKILSTFLITLGLLYSLTANATPSSCSQTYAGQDCGTNKRVMLGLNCAPVTDPADPNASSVTSWDAYCDALTHGSGVYCLGTAYNAAYSAGSCACDTGYTGSTCASCASGYIDIGGSGICVLEEYVLTMTAAIDFYVSTAGSDTTGNGSSSLPWRTIQHALNEAATIITSANKTIHIADGTYIENVEVGWNNFGRIALVGNVSTPANVTINANAGIGIYYYNPNTWGSIDGITIINGSEAIRLDKVFCDIGSLVLTNNVYGIEIYYGAFARMSALDTLVITGTADTSVSSTGILLRWGNFTGDRNDITMTKVSVGINAYDLSTVTLVDSGSPHTLSITMPDVNTKVAAIVDLDSKVTIANNIVIDGTGLSNAGNGLTAENANFTATGAAVTMSNLLYSQRVMGDAIIQVNATPSYTNVTNTAVSVATTAGTFYANMIAVATTPSGPYTSIQYNNSGAFGGSANVVFNGGGINAGGDSAANTFALANVNEATTGLLWNVAEHAMYFRTQNTPIGAWGPHGLTSTYFRGVNSTPLRMYGRNASEPADNLQITTETKLTNASSYLTSWYNDGVDGSGNPLTTVRLVGVTTSGGMVLSDDLALRDGTTPLLNFVVDSTGGSGLAGTMIQAATPTTNHAGWSVALLAMQGYDSGATARAGGDLILGSGKGINTGADGVIAHVHQVATGAPVPGLKFDYKSGDGLGISPLAPSYFIGAGNHAGSHVSLMAGTAEATTTGGLGGDLNLMSGFAAGSGNNKAGDMHFIIGTPTGSGAAGLMEFEVDKTLVYTEALEPTHKATTFTSYFDSTSSTPAFRFTMGSLSDGVMFQVDDGASSPEFQIRRNGGLYLTTKPTAEMNPPSSLQLNGQYKTALSASDYPAFYMGGGYAEWDTTSTVVPIGSLVRINKPQFAGSITMTDATTLYVDGVPLVPGGWTGTNVWAAMLNGSTLINGNIRARDVSPTIGPITTVSGTGNNLTFQAGDAVATYTERTTDGYLENWATASSLTSWTFNANGASHTLAQTTDKYQGLYAALVTVNTTGSPGPAILGQEITTLTAGTTFSTISIAAKKTGTPTVAIAFADTSALANLWNFTGASAGSYTPLSGSPTSDQTLDISSSITTSYTVIDLKALMGSYVPTVTGTKIYPAFVTSGTTGQTVFYDDVQIKQNTSADQGGSMYFKTGAGLGGSDGSYLFYQGTVPILGITYASQTVAFEASFDGINPGKNLLFFGGTGATGTNGGNVRIKGGTAGLTGSGNESAGDIYFQSGSREGSGNYTRLIIEEENIATVADPDYDSLESRYYVSSWDTTSAAVEVYNYMGVQAKSLYGNTTDPKAELEYTYNGATVATLDYEGTLMNGGGREVNVTDVGTATYNLKTSDYILAVSDTTSEAVAITLPTAQMVKGRDIVIKDTGMNAASKSITIDTEGAEHIDGSDTATLNTNGQAIQLFSDGIGWWIY